MTSRFIRRREALRIGLAGLGQLSLPGLFRLRAESPTKTNDHAVIIVWLRGGCSHVDTYDPKPDAPTEFRGPFRPIATKAPGLRLTELLPLHAKISDRFSVLRSMVQTGPGHPSGSLQLLAGDPDTLDKLVPARPDLMCIANYLRPNLGRGLPAYVGVNPIHAYDNFTIAGPAYLGPGYAPFAVLGDPSLPAFRVPNIGLDDPIQEQTLRDRRELQRGLDKLQRNIDRTGGMEASDRYESQAFDLLLSPQARQAFDLTVEDSRVRERYGLHAWGQQCLMARRLVEAGVSIVTTTFDGPQCGRVGNWDDHAVNHHVFDGLSYRAPFFDQAVSALIEDVYARGLDRHVLVVVTGEFGRTPRISYVASSGAGVASASAGTIQPGRDHWPDANSMILAGGGITTGQVIGATDARGEKVISRRVGPQDFLATIYQHLGIDYRHTTIPDPTGRPIPIVESGSAIPELVGRA
jgi:hypothetical protein